MTDRLKGVTVTFDSDIREDDAQEIINAIKMVKGVLTVTKSVVGHDDIMNRSAIRLDIQRKILDALKTL